MTPFAAPHIPEDRIPLQTLLHLAFPTFRVLCLIPLFGALLTPRVVYTPVASSDDDVFIQQPTASSFLLPPEATQHNNTLSGINPDGTKYGTFRTPRSNLQSVPPTRATTPAPSTTRGVSNFFFIHT